MILFLTTLDHSVLPFLPSFRPLLTSFYLCVFGHEILKCWKYWKTCFQYFECLPSKNISYDHIWDRGLIEHDTTQLSSLSNLLVAYQKRSVFYKILKHIFPVYRTFTLHFLIVWQNPGYHTHQHIKAHLVRF